MSSAERMGHLIDDLLTFSRMGRSELQATPIEVSGLAFNGKGTTSLAVPT